jgi:hypothetical protein
MRRQAKIPPGVRTLQHFAHMHSPPRGRAELENRNVFPGHANISGFFCLAADSRSVRLWIFQAAMRKKRGAKAKIMAQRSVGTKIALY